MERVVDVDHAAVHRASHHDVPELLEVTALDELVVLGEGGAQAGGATGIRLQDGETGQGHSFWGTPSEENVVEIGKKCGAGGMGGKPARVTRA